MPKHFAKRYPRRYATRRQSRASARKPYGGSRYGNDAFVKVEIVNPLSVTAGAEVFSTMRVNANPTTPTLAIGNSYLGDQAEFASFAQLYARYEVTGMKAEVTLNARTTFAAANLAGGLAPRIAALAVFPGPNNNVTYPRQVDCNTQGQVSTLYYAYSKDLKNSGAEFAVGVTEPYPIENQGIIQFRGIVSPTPANPGGVVGSIKFTWYVRFHGRTRATGDTFIRPKTLPEDVEESMMSYADLQAQLNSMMKPTKTKK